MTTWDEPYAWEYLARCWARADGLAWVSGVLVGGICESIDALFWRCRRDKTFRCMKARMKDRRPRGVEAGGYWWPLTKAGARARAEFCRRMAREARKEARR